MGVVDQFLLGVAGLAVVGAAFYMLTGGRPKSVVGALAASRPSNLADAMAGIDDVAKARAYDAVSDKIVAHRAGRYEAELLDALAPKSEPPA